jgi:Tfp pilus assembly protein PilF
MASTRLDILKGMVAQSPTDSFLRYGLAMEYRNANNLDAAMAEFQALIAVNPDYSAAYFHGGQTLERLGRVDEARQMYRDGIEAATRKGDLHTRSEMQAALDILGD